MGITNRQIDTLKCHSSKPVYLWDTKISGFGVKALPSGRKTFVLKYRTHFGGTRARQRWLKLGVVGSLPLAKARILAMENLSLIANGDDPQGLREKKRADPSFNDAWEKFKKSEFKRLKPTTRSDYSGYWRNYIQPRLGRHKAAEIGRADIEAIHAGMSETPYSANRVLSLISRLLNQCEAWEYRSLNSNPCKLIKPYRERSRERYLSLDELKNLNAMLDELLAKDEISIGVANGFRLLILTGARKSEIFGTRLEWLDLDNSKINLPDSKTGKRSILLSHEAIRICERQKVFALSLGSEFLFPSPKAGLPLLNVSKAWQKIRIHANIEDVRIHDLRHTCASLAVRSGMSLPVVGRLLGHTQAKTTQRYAHVHADPALEAAEAVSKFFRQSE